MSSLPLCLNHIFAEISDISEVQQVVLVTRELFLAEVINAEIVNAVQLIVSQTSFGSSESSFAGGSPFGLLHELLDSLKAGHAQDCEHERITCGLIHLLDSDTAGNRDSTAGHHIAPAFQPHGIGDRYGLQLPLPGNRQRVCL
jgi:hypothetical protein